MLILHGSTTTSPAPDTPASPTAATATPADPAPSAVSPERSTSARLRPENIGAFRLLRCYRPRPVDDDSQPPLPDGHACHPNRHLDAYLGNMVANKRCELLRRDGYMALVCGCAKAQLKSIDLSADSGDDYALRLISEIEHLFDCCARPK